MGAGVRLALLLDVCLIGLQHSLSARGHDGLDFVWLRSFETIRADLFCLADMLEIDFFPMFFMHRVIVFLFCSSSLSFFSHPTTTSDGSFMQIGLFTVAFKNVFNSTGLHTLYTGSYQRMRIVMTTIPLCQPCTTTNTCRPYGHVAKVKRTESTLLNRKRKLKNLRRLLNINRRRTQPDSLTKKTTEFRVLS